MSVSNSTSKIQYATNGSVVDFDFTFGVFASSDLVVVYTDPNNVSTTLTESSDYTVTATGSTLKNGGRVTTTTTYPSGGKITIMRQVPVTQEMDFTEGMPTLYETFEDGLDKLTMIAQQELEHINRCITIPATDAATITTEVPGASDRANTFLGFDSSGNVMVSPGSVGPIVVSTWGEGLVQSETAVEAAVYILSSGAARQQLAMNSDASGMTWVPSLQSILTAAGDIIYASAANTPARLPKGSARQQLAMDSSGTAPEWVPSPQSVMTAAGDLLYASAANTLARLAKGSASYHLLMDASGDVPSWAYPFKMYSFSRAMDASSGNVSYTGIGFKPNALIFASANATIKSFSLGFHYSNDTTSLGITINWNGTSTTFSTSNDTVRLIETAGSKEQTATVASLDSDGFTLSWTKTGTPAANTVWVWCLLWR